MIKKILFISGVIAFSGLWWVGFKKVMEMDKAPPRYGYEDPSFLGGR